MKNFVYLGATTDVGLERRLRMTFVSKTSVALVPCGTRVMRCSIGLDSGADDYLVKPFCVGGVLPYCKS